MTTYAGLYGPEALIDGSGHPITSATIDVFTHGTTTHVSLYQDNARVTPLSNPVPNGVDGSTAGRGLDTYGNLSFYIDPGRYDLRIATGAGTRTVEIEIETDPAESTASSAGRNPLTGAFHMAGYGVKADVNTVSDGAMNSGSAVLTSATAGFTSADKDKLIVVCNAKGAGVHLYGTISSYTNATTVTLSTTATANVSGTVATYGTDDTTAAQACITAACAVQGAIIPPPTAFAVSAELMVADACTFTGGYVETVNGSMGVHGQSIDFPTQAPYLTGSVATVMVASTNGYHLTAGAKAVNVEGGLGVRFAGPFHNTGHGFFGDPPAITGGTDSGVQNARMENLYCFGHDGDHYGAKLINSICSTLDHLRGWGGGVLSLESSGTLGNWGNATLNHVFGEMLTGGTADGIRISGGSHTNLLLFMRPQVLAQNAGYVNSVFAGYNMSTPGGAQRAWNNGGVNVVTIGMDLEGGLQSTDLMLGSTCHFGTYAPAGWDFSPGPMIQTRDAKRRVMDDLSHVLVSAESSGGQWALFQDTDGTKWGPATDGTKRWYLGGSLKSRGATPNYVYGAGAGTTPPVLNLNGTDTAGRVITGTGTTPAAGAQVAVTFASATTYDVAPYVLVTPNNAATAALGLYVTSVSATGFTVAAQTAPAASQAVGTYDFSYLVMGGLGTPLAPVVIDSFTRADSASSLGTADLGGAWTANVVTWGISSNQAYKPSGSAGPATIDSGRADGKIDLDLATVSGGCGAAFRLSDASNFWVTDGTHLWKFVAGVFNQMATFSAMASGDHLQVLLSGTSVTLKRTRAGVTTQIASVVDSFNSTATKHGMYSDNSTARFDNFQMM